MAKITHFLTNHELLYYLALNLRFGRKKTFRSHVIAINEDPRQIQIVKIGDLYRGELVYKIDPNIAHAGFFAVFRRMLSALYYADEIGAKPYVAYSKEFLYAQEEPVNGAEDPYEYYFHPIKAVGDMEIDHVNALVTFEPKHIRLAEQLNGKREIAYRVTDAYLDAMAGTFQKYVRLNEVMEEFVHTGIQSLGLTDRTVAVHCRGTDYNLGSKEHPVIVTPEDYFKILDPWLDESLFDTVFLATDDLKCLEQFRAHYGEKLCFYQDVQRTDGKEGDHFSQSQRKNHKYLLGAEVIRDVYTMASCNGLLAGMSEVSICTRIANRAFGVPYAKELILDKGIVLYGRGFEHRET